jgi:hypothetical protein
MSDDTTADTDPMYRILSIDGGGIYGLVSAIWLRKLSEMDESFLEPGSIGLFAGISAGAVSALILATQADPRKALREGLLERFWTERVGAFSNVMNPMAAWLSLFRIGGWVGEEDFRYVLQKYIDPNLTLGDLKQRVMISTFNWSGAREIDFGTASASPSQGYPFASFGSFGRFGAPGSFGTGTAPATHERSWRPKVFTNLGDDPDKKYRLVDIAYAAATPAGIRALRGGVGDAAVFTANPAVEAIAAAVHEFRTRQASNPSSVPVDILPRLRLLSIGNGSTIPHYWLQNFNFSLRQMSRFPTNPLRGDYFPPSLGAPSDAAIEEANYIARELLEDGYYRLAPEIMPTPVVVASLLSRFDRWRDAFIRQIYTVTEGEVSTTAVRNAAEFLKNHWRLQIPGPYSAPD